MRSKLIHGDTVRIGVIGGSITQAEGYHSYGQGLCEFLGHNYPGTAFELINAGIGATNSRYACSRVHDDLLNRRPDLIVIEFAVNDAPADSATYEGLVRLCLKNCAGPVMLLFTMDRSGSDVVQAVESRIGTHYDLPMISYRNALMPPLDANRLAWELITADNVHPNNNGHLIIGYLFYSSIVSSLTAAPDTVSLPAALPPFLISDYYENAGIWDTACHLIDAVEYDGWEQHVGNYGRVAFASSDSCATISFRCVARELAIGYRRSGEYDSNLQLVVDSMPLAVINNHLAGDLAGGFMALYTIYKDSMTTGHDIRLLKSNGDVFSIEALLYVE